MGVAAEPFSVDEPEGGGEHGGDGEAGDIRDPVAEGLAMRRERGEGE